MASIVSSMSVAESLRWMWLWFFVKVQMTVSLVGVWERETVQLKRIITEGSGIYAKQWTRCDGFHYDDCYRRLWECGNTENGCNETCISVLIDAITPMLRRMSYCLWFDPDWMHHVMADEPYHESLQLVVNTGFQIACTKLRGWSVAA